MSDRELFLKYRLFTVRVGLVLSWLGIAGYVWLANREPKSMRDGTQFGIAALSAIAVLLTVAP